MPVQPHMSSQHSPRGGCTHGEKPVAPAAELRIHLMAAHLCRSVFYLPKPRPLSHLVADLWRGPTLVLQGALDPLNDAKGGASSSLLSSKATVRLRLHMPVVPQSMVTPTVSCYVKSVNVAHTRLHGTCGPVDLQAGRRPCGNAARTWM